MKIDSNYTNYEVDNLSQRTRSLPADHAGRPEATRSTETDKASPDTVVNLSRASREAQLIKETIENTQDIRQDRVDQLKQDLLNGTYQVDPKAVAGKMVSYFTNDFSMP